MAISLSSIFSSVVWYYDTSTCTFAIIYPAIKIALMYS